MIYSIDDLCQVSYDDIEIEDVSKNLQNSLIINMFRHIGNTLSDKEIIKFCKENKNWYNRFSWTSKQRNSYIQKVEDALYNLYRFNRKKCTNSAYNWILKYGFKLKTTSNKTLQNNEIF
jgi:hypothetical protein